jgi:Cft2 family RNA processing exonuclease
MRLTFLGGADEVGASGTLIEIAGKKLLVDAGIRIIAKNRRSITDDQLPDLRLISEAGGPDYILVTHAHTDHTGALPLVVERYPNVPVLATAPSVALIRVLQADAQRIMKNRQEEENELPLFDEVAVERLLNAIQVVEMRQSVRLGEGLQVTYYTAGHILGAAMLVLESEEGTLVMSGDLSLSPQRAVKRAETPRIKADALVLESTYGGKLHANRTAEEKRLIETLKVVVARGGKALIPAFALGRAQEVLQILLANRDEIGVPVYADGMVRSVCMAYTRFADWLPPETVKSAKEDPLFFRGAVKAVQSLAQRDEIARGDSPAIIVSSSGMLTGGPSAFYARHLAGDARNAILLTGYQDEEAPGRFLQRLLKERGEGEEIPFTVDGQTVSLRCELGTYSLSAHADEAELISVAESFDMDEVALVHGDPGARHSLATGLRARSRIVRLPVSGQALEYSFQKRPWQVGKVSAGSHAGAVDPAALWEALKAQAGSFYSARELAQIWAGDAELVGEISAALAADSLYFTPDWRSAGTFQVRTAEQVERTRRCREIMGAHPQLIGQLVVLRDTNNRPRIGVVQGAHREGFEAAVLGAKGRHYAGDALVWAVGVWQGPREGGALNAALNTLAKAAKLAQEGLLPFEKRQALVNAASPVQPPDLLPAELPEGLTREAALTAITLRLASDGALWSAEGLLPKRAFSGEPLEQNAARAIALESFPPEARLRKVGLEVHRKRLTLTFDFPERVIERFSSQIEAIEEATGWDVQVNPATNQQALGGALTELLPPGSQIVKGPSFFMDRREVQAELRGVDDLTALAASFLDLSGYRLTLGGEKGTSAATPASASATPRSGRPPMEINAAYGLLKSRLEAFGLLKTSLKQGEIVLTFISPQVGMRCQEVINALAEETGYALRLHPNPDQNAILTIVQREVRAAGWGIRKGPGLYVERAEVVYTLATRPDESLLATVTARILEQTGYTLVVK